MAIVNSEAVTLLILLARVSHGELRLDAFEEVFGHQRDAVGGRMTLERF